jgi:hypothetical protein
MGREPAPLPIYCNRTDIPSSAFTVGSRLWEAGTNCLRCIMTPQPPAKTPVKLYLAARHHIPEDSIFYGHLCVILTCLCYSISSPLA